MLHRSAHYWLCCAGFEVDDVLRQLRDAPVRVIRATEQKTKFGPYDYLFIDAADRDMPADLLLEALLEKLEANREVIVRWGDQLISGVNLVAQTSEGSYSEVIGPATLARLGSLKLQLTLKCEGASSDVP